jgi:hypothetical protein
MPGDYVGHSMVLTMLPLCEGGRYGFAEETTCGFQ